MRIISALIVAVAYASEAWSLVPPFQRTNVFGRGGGVRTLFFPLLVDKAY
jgi:hypothetical protein